MQMYRVKYVSRLGKEADLGDVIVCASNADAAMDTVRAALDLPASGTEYDVVRVKPSIYQISRNVKSGLDGLPAMGTFPGSWFMPEQAKWDLFVSITVSAPSESAAARKLGNILATGDSNNKTLMVKCERKEYRVKESAVEKQGIYTAHRIFSGGAGRPR